MNCVTTFQSPRKRPCPRPFVRNPYAKHNNRTSNANFTSASHSASPSAANKKCDDSQTITLDIRKDKIDCDEYEQRSENKERSLGMKLELSPEFNEITEGIRNLSIHDNDGDKLQKKAIALAKEGKNIFLTGKAGTGKSWTIRKMVRACQNRTIQLTAPTGIAAINIGGRTIHSWGGFLLGQHYSDFDRLLGKRRQIMIRETDTLLIDEISMVDGHLLDVLECMVAIVRCYKRVKERLQRIRAINEHLYGQKNCTMSPHLLDLRWKTNGEGFGDIEPWGGLQVIVVGDFFQLPPVPRNLDENIILNEDEELGRNIYDLEIGRQGSYAFESLAWQKSQLHTIELEKVHRQQSPEKNNNKGTNTNGLIELLNAMREGAVDPIQHQEALEALQTPLPSTDNGIVPTELHARNRTVESINNRNLDALPEEPIKYESLDELVLDSKYKDRLVEKYDLTMCHDMPYLFASVRNSRMSHELVQAREKLAAMDRKKEDLKSKDDFAALMILQPRLEECKLEMEILELEEQEKSTISASTIAKYLESRGAGNRYNAEAVFRNFERFDKRLQKDFRLLEAHATLRFFRNGCRVKESITLKGNAQVMLLWNLDLEKGLANGSRGVVKKFVPIAVYRRLLQAEVEKQQEAKANQNQNVAVHESSTISECVKSCEEDPSLAKNEETEATKDEIMVEETPHPVEAELEDDVDYGIDQRIVEELKQHLVWLSEKHLLHDEKRSIDHSVLSGMTNVPYVEFIDGSKRLILPVPFKKVFQGCGIAIRWQLPLCLAWAISIHKSQGMTIDWLHVDLKGCFENGQAYVACSRGRSLESIEVLNFDINEIRTSGKVKEFYQSLNNNFSKPYTNTWADSIAAFDTMRKQRNELTRRYKDKRCEWCGAICRVHQVKKRNHNEGRFFVGCTNSNNGERNHHFEWISPSSAATKSSPPRK